MTSAAAVEPIASPARDESNPFMGLRPFQGADSLYFFGRREQTLELLELLHHSRFVAVVGRSGCGKSSLVRAGLLPALEAGFLVGKHDEWTTLTFTPGRTPLQRLAAELQGLGGQIDSEQVAVFPTLSTRAQLRLVAKLLGERAPGRNVLLVVDQFEEVFEAKSQANPEAVVSSPEDLAAVASRRAEAEAFVALLLALPSTSTLPIFTVLTMRSDFVGDCDLFPGLAEAMNTSRYLVPRLNREMLRLAITGPALVRGVHFEPRLIDRLLNEIGDHSEQLPILEHALLQTWRERRRRRANDVASSEMLLDADYREAGTISEALSRHAEQALKGLDEAVVARLFQALTDTDVEKRRKRRAQTLAQLEAAVGIDRVQIRMYLKRFQEDERHFVSIQSDPSGSGERVEISHESLIRSWPRLMRWVDEEREARDDLLKLVQASAESERFEQSLPTPMFGILSRFWRWLRSNDRLLRGPELTRFEDWRRRREPTARWARRYVGDEEKYEVAMAFLEQSGRLQRLSQRGLAVAITLAIVLLTLAAGFAMYKWNEANTAKDEARWRLKEKDAAVESEKRERVLAREHARLAGALGTNDVALQVALLREANATDASWCDSALRALQSPITEAIFQVDKFGITSAAFAAGSAGIVGVSSTALFVWGTPEAEPQPLLQPTSPTPTALFYARVDDTSYAVAATYALDSKWNARVWRFPGSSSSPRELKDLGAPLKSFALAQDGHIATVTGDAGSYVTIWGADGESRRTVELKKPDVGAPTAGGLKFSPDGEALLVANTKVVQSFDVASGTATATSDTFDSDVTAISYSSDGRRIAAASGTVAYLLVASTLGRQLALKGHENSVLAAAFNHDGTSVVTGARDNTARVWRSDGSRSVTLVGHQRAVVGTEFSRDGHVLTTSLDGTVRVWSLRGLGSPDVLADHTKAVRAVAVSEDGRIATGSLDQTVRLWSPGSSKSSVVTQHRSPVWTVAFSPNGKRLVSGSLDGTVAIQELESPAPSVSLQAGTGVLAVAFSPDGDKVATGLRDGAVRLWNADGSHKPVGYVGPARDLGVVYSLAFAARGEKTTLAATFSAPWVRVWSTSSPDRPAELEEEHGPIYSVAFGPDGALLTGSADGSAHVWVEGPKGWSSKPLHGHTSAVAAVAFNRDGTRMATGSWDNTVRIWSYPQGELVSTLRGHEDHIRAVAFIGNDAIVTGSDDKTARIYRLLYPEQIRKALWASSYCLPPERRQGMLGETEKEAAEAFKACTAQVAKR